MKTLRHCLSLALFNLVVSAQSPAITIPKSPDAAFFSQDSKILMVPLGEEALKLDGKDAELQVDLGDIWLGLGDRVKAESYFLEAKRQKGDSDPRTLHWIAQSWMRHGFKEEALAAYQAMVSIKLSRHSDDMKNILFWAATDLMKAGFVKDAAAYMERSYAFDKDDPNNCIEFGRAALFADQKDLAATYFARAVKAEPGDVDVWLDIASAHADYVRSHGKPKGAPQGN